MVIACRLDVRGPDTPMPLCNYSQWSGNSKVLLVTVTLFSSITLAQFYAAVASSSNALLVDAVSMLVDTATYMGNLASECFRDTSMTRGRCEILASGSSFVLLIGAALWGIADGFAQIGQPSTEGNDLEANVVFGFGLGGLVLDLLSFLAFQRWGREVLGVSPAAQNSNVEDELFTQEGRVPPIRFIETERMRSPPRPSMNMCSAFLHVGADFLRSLTTTVEGVAVIWFGFQGSNADGIATVIVSGTILAGSCGVGISFLSEKFKRSPVDEHSNADYCQNDDIANVAYADSDRNDYIQLATPR